MVKSYRDMFIYEILFSAIVNLDDIEKEVKRMWLCCCCLGVIRNLNQPFVCPFHIVKYLLKIYIFPIHIFCYAWVCNAFGSDFKHRFEMSLKMSDKILI